SLVRRRRLDTSLGLGDGGGRGAFRRGSPCGLALAAAATARAPAPFRRRLACLGAVLGRSLVGGVLLAIGLLLAGAEVALGDVDHRRRQLAGMLALGRLALGFVSGLALRLGRAGAVRALRTGDGGLAATVATAARAAPGALLRRGGLGLAALAGLRSGVGL